MHVANVSVALSHFSQSETLNPRSNIILQLFSFINQFILNALACFSLGLFRQSCGCCIYDFSKSFDKVPQGRLLWRVGSHGIPGELADWMRIYMA